MTTARARPHLVDPSHHVTLDGYSEVGSLTLPVGELRAVGATVAPRLRGRTVWMVNSTAKGGGVAEMLPGLVSIMRELGLAVEWAVIEAEDPEFFRLTKRLHNLIHGEGDPELSAADRELYDAVSRANADALRDSIGPDDILVVHDPQPLGMGAILAKELGVRSIWRCHIGLDKRTRETRAAWSFLEPYIDAYEHAVFSVPEYMPEALAARASIIHPAIDPLSHKNRGLAISKLVGILVNAGLLEERAPVRTPPFEWRARRMQRDGSWAPATEPDDIGLLYRPIVTQVSRWDRLKGWEPLLRGFAALRSDPRRVLGESSGIEELGWRTIENARLVLAGPDPESVPDDPEQLEVLDELRAAYLELPEALQSDVVLLALPMQSAKENALMVNALQRCSTVVAQNSIREAFGLTVAEAMYKYVAVMGTSAAGIRQQIHDGLEGRLVPRPGDPDSVARTLGEMLSDEHARERWGRAAQRRVLHEFLIFTQVRRWLEVLTAVADGVRPG